MGEAVCCNDGANHPARRGISDFLQPVLKLKDCQGACFPQQDSDYAARHVPLWQWKRNVVGWAQTLCAAPAVAKVMAPGFAAQAAV